MLSNFARLALSTKNNLVPAAAPIVISTPVAECRVTGSCSDTLLCEVEFSVPITGAPPGAYITVQETTAGGASVVVIESAADMARIEFSNEGLDTNFISYEIEVRDSGGTILETFSTGFSNSNAQTKLQLSALPTCAATPFIIISPTSYSADYLADQFFIVVTSNTSWSVRESGGPGGTDWITFSIVQGGTGGNNGNGNGRISVSLLQNPINNNGRSAELFVENVALDPDIVESCIIVQNADPGGSGGNP